MIVISELSWIIIIYIIDVSVVVQSINANNATVYVFLSLCMGLFYIVAGLVNCVNQSVYRYISIRESNTQTNSSLWILIFKAWYIVSIW